MKKHTISMLVVLMLFFAALQAMQPQGIPKELIQSLTKISADRYVRELVEGNNIPKKVYKLTKEAESELKSALIRAYSDILDLFRSRPIVLKHQKPVNSVAFGRGRLLATGGNDGQLRLWDVSTKPLSQSFKGHKDSINSVAFSSDGKFIATGSDDETARLWDITTGQTIKILRGHTGEINSVAFSPHGKLLATGSRDKTACLWNIRTGRAIQTFQRNSGPGMLIFHDPVISIAFSHDGSFLSTVYGDMIICLWDAQPYKNLSWLQLLTIIKLNNNRTLLNDQQWKGLFDSLNEPQKQLIQTYYETH
jgi:WD40 repeat protein